MYSHWQEGAPLVGVQHLTVQKKLGDLESHSKRKQMKFNSTEWQVLLSGVEQALLA